MPVTDRSEIRGAAEEFARNVEQQYGKALSFDQPSLAILDAFLSEWLDMASVYDAIDERVVASLTRPLCCFIGECLVASKRAQWHDAASADSSLPSLALPDGKLLDLEPAVAAVLRGQVPPCFHRLALELGHAETRGSSQV